MKRKTKWVIAATICLAAVGGAVAIASRAKSAGPEKLDTPVAKVAYADVQVEVTEIGTVEPEVKVDVKSALSGKVVDLPCAPGTSSGKGNCWRRSNPTSTRLRPWPPCAGV